jgi:hypothetical protein
LSGCTGLADAAHDALATIFTVVAISADKSCLAADCVATCLASLTCHGIGWASGARCSRIAGIHSIDTIRSVGSIRTSKTRCDGIRAICTGAAHESCGTCGDRIAVGARATVDTWVGHAWGGGTRTPVGTIYKGIGTSGAGNAIGTRSTVGCGGARRGSICAIHAVGAIRTRSSGGKTGTSVSLGTIQTRTTRTAGATKATIDRAIIDKIRVVREDHAGSTDSGRTARAAICGTRSTCAAHTTLEIAMSGDVCGSRGHLQTHSTRATASCGRPCRNGVATSPTGSTGEIVGDALGNPGRGDATKTTLSTAAGSTDSDRTTCGVVVTTLATGTALVIQSATNRWGVDAVGTATTTTTTAALGRNTGSVIDGLATGSTGTTHTCDRCRTCRTTGSTGKIGSISAVGTCCGGTTAATTAASAIGSSG